MNIHDSGAVLFTINLQSLARFYERVIGMNLVRTETDHIVLETGSFRLILHQIPEQHAGNIVITNPPKVREAAATKLAFRVIDIAQAREAAAQCGGGVYPRDREWQYDGSTVCDGFDPDGNVFQLFS